MPQDDSTDSTDLIDVMRGALAAPWLRVAVVWLASAAGTLLMLTVHLSSLSALEKWRSSYEPWVWNTDYDVGLVSFGAPVTFIGSIAEWPDNNCHDAIRWLVLILLFAALLVWLRAAIRICAGRWFATSVCHVFAASSMIATGRMGKLWWVGVGLTAVMVLAWFRWDRFRELRASEANYERDGI